MRQFTYSLFSWVILLSSFNSNLLAQEEYSNEKIWGGEFWAESVWGIRSMAKGTSYTIQGNDPELGSVIEEYSYKSGKKLRTIVSSISAFDDARERISSYTFSDDERYILILSLIHI